MIEAADGDAEVQVAAEAEVAHRPGVGAPAGGLQFLDDLHGPHLGRAGDRARGEGGFEHLQAVLARGQLPFHLGDDVHHVGVALDA